MRGINATLAITEKSMENIKMEDIVEKDSTSESKQVEETSETNTTEQDPLKIELDRVQKKPKSEIEKAKDNLFFNAKRAKELGIDPAEILGFKSKEDEEVDEDDTPVTVGMLRKIQQENASKTALQLADEISNEAERELVKYHLQNTIKSTGIPTEDLKLSRALVNSVKNSQIIEETTRATPVKTHSNSSGVDAKQEKEITYSPDELQMMKPPFNMTPAQILEARGGKKYSFKNSKV